MRKIIIEIDLDKEDTGAQLQNGIDTLGLFLDKPAAVVEEEPKPVSDITGMGGEEEPKPITVMPGTLVKGAGAPPPPAATTAPPPPAAVDVDEEGLPWDGRIHAASKAKLVKGNTWKLKRGVDAALVKSVKDELRATMAAAPATTETTAAEAFADPEPLGDTPMSFPELMNIITERMAGGTLSQPDLDAILVGVEIPTLHMLASRPDLIPTVAAELEAV